jgi:hypothetical protein
MCVYNLKIYILYFLYWIYTKKIRISSTHLHKYIKSRRKYQKFPDPRFIHFFWVLKEMEQSGIIFPRNSILIPRPIDIHSFGSHRKIPLSFSRQEEEFPKKCCSKKYENIFLFSILIGFLYR